MEGNDSERNINDLLLKLDEVTEESAMCQGAVCGEGGGKEGGEGGVKEGGEGEGGDMTIEEFSSPVKSSDPSTTPTTSTPIPTSKGQKPWPEPWWIEMRR